MKETLIIILFAALLFSCGAPNSDENSLPSFDYYNQTLGWRIKIPEGWKKNNLTDVVLNNETGIAAMEEAMDKKVDITRLSYCLNFQKDEINMFQSVFEPFEEGYDGHWKNNNDAIKQLFCNVYSDKGEKIDSSATVIETISGKDFQTYEIRIYDKNDQIQMSQIFYAALINGHDFSVCLNYNNPEDRDALLNIWKRSKFDF